MFSFWLNFVNCGTLSRNLLKYVAPYAENYSLESCPRKIAPYPNPNPNSSPEGNFLGG